MGREEKCIDKRIGGYMRYDNQAITYYQVQAKWVKEKRSRNDKWFLHSDTLRDEFVKHSKHPDSTFTASGTCWQLCGTHAVMTEAAGLSWLKRARQWFKANPPEKDYKVKLRLAKVTEVKVTEVIS